MPDISTIHDQIRERLAELEDLIAPLRREADQLKQMTAPSRSQPDATSPPRAAARTARPAQPAGRATPRAAAHAAPAKRGRPPGSGNRAQEATAKIREQPGITAAELAQAMGIKTNYLYRVLPRLESEGAITKKGRGYHPAPQARSSDPTPGAEGNE